MKVIKKNGGVDYLMYQLANGGTAEIFDIAVCSERGKGIGTQMVNEMIEDISVIGVKIIFAFTRYENELARKFYSKNGFAGTTIPGFYPEGDGVIYVKKI